ncbi:hypothetical protein KCM76_04880 [Zooshikella marina]|uniref:hypothetical protein n=1 Tax=Zooshikella ganghwensis TaxID=202772 RepID=UPI001BB09F2E|nr:hypothetical protein [Zooshikella ganghwensis]MBU2705302.1 hypothetical protein [Zooshikella ganghwensis]
MKIDTQPVTYFSELDEKSFFTWAQDIDCVSSIKMGCLQLEVAKLNEDSIRELLALFERYKLDPKKLSLALNHENESWFKNPDAFWYQEIFGSA